MKIIETVGYTDKVIMTNITSFTDGNAVVAQLNYSHKTSTKSYKLVEDNYELRTSIDKYLEEAEIR